MMNMRCQYCGNQWKPEHLDKGSNCPTCGALVHDQMKVQQRNLEVRWYSDESRKGFVYEGWEDGEPVWKEVFHYPDDEDEIRTRLESKWPEWYEVIARLER